MGLGPGVMMVWDSSYQVADVYVRTLHPSLRPRRYDQQGSRAGLNRSVEALRGRCLYSGGEQLFGPWIWCLFDHELSALQALAALCTAQM